MVVTHIVAALILSQGDWMMNKKVIVAGHICLDITPVFPEGLNGNISEILMPGKLIQMGAADVHTGGAVANTGLGMKILGADVSLMGKVGNDEFGNIILGILNKYDASREMIISDTDSTSYSVVLAIPGTDRIFLHNSGANHSFTADDISADALEEAALFHFGYPPLMRSMYENNGEELLKIMQKTKLAGCSTSMDMAAVDPKSEAGKADWKSILKKVLPYVDFFMPSVEELCFMMDPCRFEHWQKRACGRDITEVISMDDIKPLADKCMEYGATVLVIKCGVSGMYYKTASREKMTELITNLNLKMDSWSEKEGFEKSYTPDRVLSGTGAGDTSIAAFLTAMLEGEGIEQCMHLAAAAGASCVAAYDALSGLKPLDELRTKIAAGWAKNELSFYRKERMLLC